LRLYVKLVFVRFLTHETLNSSIKSKLLEKTKVVERKHPLSLTVTLRNGKTKIYLDSTKKVPSVERQTFTAIEQVADSYLLIYRQLWESSNYVLLSLKNGFEYPLAGYPLVSPNRQYMLTAAQDLDTGFNENLLELYRLTASDLTLIYRTKPEVWGPATINWETNSQVTFTKKQFNPDYGVTENNPLFLESKAQLKIEPDNRVILNDTIP
ncbi:hypothetical protein, partial [Microbulbifer epialgicus]